MCFVKFKWEWIWFRSFALFFNVFFFRFSWKSKNRFRWIGKLYLYRLHLWSLAPSSLSSWLKKLIARRGNKKIYYNEMTNLFDMMSMANIYSGKSMNVNIKHWALNTEPWWYDVSKAIYSKYFLCFTDAWLSFAD